MNIKGTIKKIFATETVGASGFQKRKVWVEIDLDTKYPQTIEIEFQGDKCSLADTLYEGMDAFNFSINLRGREWTSPAGEKKVFNTIVAWKVQVEGGQSQPNTFNKPAETNVPGADVSGGGEDNQSDLPF
jgi:hypothetical protein